MKHRNIHYDRSRTTADRRTRLRWWKERFLGIYSHYWYRWFE